MELPPPDGGIPQEYVATTLFGNRFGLLVIDELSAQRNVHRMSVACHALRRCAWGVVGLTATPIHNGPLVSVTCVGSVVIANHNFRIYGISANCWMSRGART